MLRTVLTILAKDLRLRVRDRSAFVIGILAPLVLGTILSQVIGDFDRDFSAEWAIVDEDGGDIGREVSRQLGRMSDDLTVRSGLTAEEARAQVDDGELQAAVVIPAGFVAGMQPGGDQKPLTVIGHADADISQAIARGVADGIAAQAEATRLSVATALAGSQDADSQVAAPSMEIDQPPAVQIITAGVDERELDGTTYLMAGLGALFVFFLVQYGVFGLLEERQDGTLSRLLAAPIRPLAIPTAKALTSLVLGVTGLTVLALVSSLALGADWGDPLAAAVLIVAMVLAAVSIVGIVAGVAKTAQQAGNAQSVIAMILGLLGGSFFPIAQGEGFLAKLSLATPHYWFLRGLADGKVGGLADAWPSVVALLVFTTVAGTAGLLLLRRGAWR